MIVPHTTLLRWAGLGVIPFATLAALVPQAWAWCLAPIAGVTLAAAWDAWRGRRVHRGLRIELPGQVRLLVGRPGRFELRVVGFDRSPRRLRLGLEWPGVVQPERPEVVFELPAEEVEGVSLTLGCTAWKRGRYAVAAVHWEADSPWRLWSIRRWQRQSCTFSLYPDLWRERRRLSALFLPRGAHGWRRQRVVGKGREFEQLRDYAPGDSYEDIQWKATARRGRPVTRLFQVERTQEVYVAVDTSRLSGRPVGGAVRGGKPEKAGRVNARDREVPVPPVPELERRVTAALLLGLAAQRQGDRFGLLTFGDRVHGFLRASGGPGHLQRCRELLLEVEPRPVAPDFDEFFAWARVRLRHRVLLVVLTALDDPVLAESFERGLELVRRQHLVLVQQLRSEAVRPLFEGTLPGDLNEVYQRLGGHLRWNDLRQLQLRLRRHGVHFTLTTSEALCADLVGQYLEIRQRQQL